MFNRQKDPRDDNAASPEGSWRAEIQRLGQDPGPAPTSAASISTGNAETGPVSSGPVSSSIGSAAATTEQLQNMLSRLDSLGQFDEAPANPEKSVGDDDVITHGGTLRAALEARENAQRILELATKERAEATAQSEQILLEATAMSVRLQKEAKADSDRIHRETQAWAADQRRAVKELIQDVRATATSEAEQLRQEAMASVQEEVESFALHARTREREAAERDAEAIRAHARATLEQSRSMLADIQTAIGSLTESMDSFVTQMRDRSAEVEAVLSDPSLSTKPVSDEPGDTSERQDTGTDTTTKDAHPRNKLSAGTKGVPHLPTPRAPVSDDPAVATGEATAEPPADKTAETPAESSQEQGPTGSEDEK